LRLIDLLNDLEELVELLRGELDNGTWLNAYLLAAGISQVAEDYVESDRGLLLKAAANLVATGSAIGRAASFGLRFVDSSRRRLRGLWGTDERVEAWLRDLRPLVRALAPGALTGEITGGGTEDVATLSSRVLACYPDLPLKLRRSVLRLPSCFRSFDQHPDDMAGFAEMFSDEFPDWTKPIAVVGIRTSGSYLAPLVAESLEMRGFDQVVCISMRPGSPVSPSQQRVLDRVKSAGGMAVVVDDPPTTGGSMRRTYEALVAGGMRPDSIVLLVALSAAMTAPPDAIRRLRCIVQPWSAWSIHDRLAVTSVHEALSDLMGPRRTIAAVERVRVEHPGRGHASARFRVVVQAGVGGGSSTILDIHADSVGLGYFGEHSLAISKRLGAYTPRVYGLADGLLFRQWLPPPRRISAAELSNDDDLVKAVVDYVSARNAALAVPADRSRDLRGRQPVWEAASNILSRAFGRGWAWARIPFVDPLVKQTLRVEEPCVVDGSMGPGRWFRGASAARRLQKIDFDRRAFSNLDLASYDPVYDLASFAADVDSDDVRATYEKAAGASITAERWFLLQAVHLWDRLRLGDGDEAWLRRALSRTAQRYFAEVFLEGVATPPEGPLVALDIDGVLEGEAVGISSLTMSSAMALRALLRHGYRPVLMTGRSLPEVVDRCRTLGFAGGVAEYGSAVYDHRRESSASLLSREQTSAVARARAAVASVAGVTLDSSYCCSVRAFRLGSDSRRRAPDASAIARMVSGASVELIPGDSQIDMVAAGVDKGAALARLAQMLGASLDGIALAVGDGARDVSAFGLARISIAPAHAPAAVRKAAGRTTRKGYQAGLADAVHALIGHRPGACPACRMGDMPAERRDMLRLLSAQERGRASMVATGVSLLLSTSRLRRGGE